MLEDKPMLTPIIPAAIGTLGVYFMDDKYNPLFYGMIGAAGGDIIESTGLFNGLSRMSFKIDGVQELDENPLAAWTNNMQDAAKELEEQEEDFDFVAMDDDE